MLLALITVVAPLFIGAVTYYIFCPNVWFVKQIDNMLGVDNHVNLVIEFTPLFKYIRNYFFDFIWAFSLINALHIVMNNNAMPIVLYVIVATALGTIMECLQLFKVVQGTFDVCDILIEFSACIIGAYIINKTRRLLINEKI